MPSIPALRIRAVNDLPKRLDRRFVIYWMVAARRTASNFGLQRAGDHARQLGKPLLVLEALRCGYEWASDRLHAFVIAGMADNQAALAGRPVRYYPYVEPSPGDGRGLLETLASDAAVIVTDDYPAFFLPRMVARAGEALDVRIEAVDSNGLLPLRAAERAYPTAHAFRAFLQRELPAHLGAFPLDDPLAGAGLSAPPPLPRHIQERWPRAQLARASGSYALGRLPIDHAVAPGPLRGGARAARATLTTFLDQRLARYPAARNQPDQDASSGISPYLHFGHVSAHEIFSALMTREGWTRRRLSRPQGGRKEGWWNVSAEAEAFLDELVTWRELGGNMCALRRDHDRYESLPAWAQATLEAHAADARPWRYSLARSSSAAGRMTPCGTPHRPRLSVKGACTTTFACCGARRSSSGRRAPVRRWR